MEQRKLLPTPFYSSEPPDSEVMISAAAASIGSWVAISVVDHKSVDGDFLRLELKTKLLLDGSDEVWPIGFSIVFSRERRDFKGRFRGCGRLLRIDETTTGRNEAERHK